MLIVACGPGAHGLSDASVCCRYQPLHFPLACCVTFRCSYCRSATPTRFHTHAHTHTNTYAHTHTRARTHTHTHPHYTHTQTNTHTHTHTHQHTHGLKFSSPGFLASPLLSRSYAISDSPSLLRARFLLFFFPPPFLSGLAVRSSRV